MKQFVPQGADLYEILTQQHIALSAPCGGKASCGKCQVRVLQGDLPVTEAESRLLSHEQLDQGIRLACCHRRCESDVVVEVREEGDGFQVLGVERMQYQTAKKSNGVGLAVDIGTTTLAMALVDLATGRVLREIKKRNPQRMYGGDVISRIQACQQYGVKRLQELVLQEIRQVILSTQEAIQCVYVCGNTTMSHIFLGIDPESLSVYPYQGRFEATRVVEGKVLFDDVTGEKFDFPVILLPCPSAFVGGDVVAGIISTRLMEKENALLVDLGTNGEMALHHNGTIYTTSTAAGPAFEGGNMACGVASIPGAICQIQMEDDQVEYRTIGGQPPIGICGSGYMEGIGQLLMQGLVDETGYLEEAVEIEGQIRILPEDIRHFQLAKSAVRSGMELLCRKAGVPLEQVTKVFISGGFGKSSNLASLAQLKIIPKEWIPKTTLLGNTALDGTIQAMLMQKEGALEQIRRTMVSMDLAAEEDFQKEYLKHMRF